MANAIATQKIIDGSRNLIIKVTIVGDGSGEETDTVILDASAYVPATTTYKLMKVDFSLVGFSGVLEWDATANITLISMPADYTECRDFTKFGGLINNAGTGRTGDILITTTGLGSGDAGDIVFTMKKREVPVYR